LKQAIDKIDKLLEEAQRPRRTLILIRGNPKYWLPGTSEKFYNDIREIFKDFNIKEFESNIISSTIPPTKKDDIIIGFSRGCGYAKRLKEQGRQGYYVGIGCDKKREIQDMHIIHPDDKTFKNDMSPKSLKAHWTLTPEMKRQLQKLI
jgi:hypothetical protein